MYFLLCLFVIYNVFLLRFININMNDSNRVNGIVY